MDRMMGIGKIAAVGAEYKAKGLGKGKVLLGTCCAHFDARQITVFLLSGVSQTRARAIDK